MNNKINFKFWFYTDIFILFILITIKGYLFIFETNFHSLNLNNIKTAEEITKNKNEFSFAVLGNIKNSISIFDKKMIDKINKDKLDFVISTGNAVLDGAEDKYRILNKTLKKINSPVIVGLGDNEVLDDGALRFYKHFGPFYFSFNINNAYFIFLDTTGETSELWQREWLKKELEVAQKYKYKFVFMNKPPYKVENTSLLNIKNNDKYIESEKYRKFLTSIFSKYNVTSVFASNIEIFDNKNIGGVSYYTSGGAGGGLLLNNKNSFYHYIKVNVSSTKIEYSIIKQKKTPNLAIYQFFENIWVYIHSLFYINFINFVFFLSILVFIGIIIYMKAVEDTDYYRNFDDIPKNIQNKKKLNIAMFTNNYYPFIGGVPISIERLVNGLKKQGHNVYIFAPKYPEDCPTDTSNIIRCKLITYHRTTEFNFPIINIFSPKIEKIFNSYNIDIIHIHHPFWMGTKGLRLAKKYKIPVVLTYHTRLEKYAHNIPICKTLFKNVISHYIIKRFSQKCDAIFAPTNTAKEYLKNIGVSKYIEILPTGIDFERYNRIQKKEVEILKQKYKNNNEIILCSVSRLTKEKNLYFLLEGIKYIKEHINIPFKCIIAGEGPEKENILKIIKDTKLEDVVKLIGSIQPEKICEYYMASDIFIFASQSETQGMVLLEAMAGKCPVVAIRSSGIDDVIHNGYNGFKTKVDVQIWSEKIIGLMKNPDILKEMSQNAYLFSKTFSIEVMAAKAAKVYLSLNYKQCRYIHEKNT